MTELAWENAGAGFIQFPDGKLEYLMHGPSPREAMTIVMLHEGLGSVALWKDFPQRVSAATGCGVFVYSRYGYGKSAPAKLPRPVDYMTIEAMEVLPLVLNKIGLENGILFGHSDGATIAAINAGSAQDFRIRGLVLMAPHFFTEKEGLNSIAAAAVSYKEGDLRQRLARYHDDVDNAFFGWNDAWLNPDFRDWNVAEVIDYLRIPVLAIQGQEDEYGTLAQIREIQARSYAPVDVEILAGCGHSPHRDKPAETLAAVTDFVTRLRRLETEPVEVT